MDLADKVKLIPRELRSDERGWFLKVMNGTEPGLPPRTGEVYVTMGLPGQVRGNHYHHQTSEWFTVIQGRAIAVVVDPVTGERLQWAFEEGHPTTLYVPAGLAHAFRNPSDSTMRLLLLAYADRMYDPNDVCHYIAIEV